MDKKVYQQMNDSVVLSTGINGERVEFFLVDHISDLTTNAIVVTNEKFLDGKQSFLKVLPRSDVTKLALVDWNVGVRSKFSNDAYFRCINLSDGDIGLLRIDADDTDIYVISKETDLGKGSSVWSYAMSRSLINLNSV